MVLAIEKSSEQHQDRDGNYPSAVVTCPVVEIVARYLGVPLGSETLGCERPHRGVVLHQQRRRRQRRRGGYWWK